MFEDVAAGLTELAPFAAFIEQRVIALAPDLP